MISIKDLTLQEKITLLTGEDLWKTVDLNKKIPSIVFSDGPNGLRKMKLNSSGYWEDIPSNAYINVVNACNTWDKEGIYKHASLIAEDCIENSIDVLLAPGVNIKRTPLCGRNFEYFSEDPFLAGTMAFHYIKGVQDKGIGTSLKHFCCNNREIRRCSQSSNVEERVLHEIYAEAFRIALKAKPFSVMNSYNLINDVYSAHNKHTNIDILRNELGFDSLLISDWLAVRNSALAIKAGTNLRMPFSDQAEKEIKQGLAEGIITEQDIDNSISYLFKALEKNEENKKLRKCQYKDTKRLEEDLKFGEESIVLLKNNNVLPLKTDKKLSVIGYLNTSPILGGGGSALVKSKITQKPLSEILKECGYEVDAPAEVKQCTMDPTCLDRMAIFSCQKSDVSVILVGDQSTIESEGYDRQTIKLCKREEDLINHCAKVSKQTVVIIEAGSAIDCSAWISNVDAVIFAGYLGDNTNQILANILSGKANPSGKLSETFPVCLEDTLLKDYSGEGLSEPYFDDIYVGYRYYDKNRIKVAFPFGHGLSYSTFEYNNIGIEEKEDSFKITFDITNVSNVEGREVAQIYVKTPGKAIYREERALKGFASVLLRPGETKTVKENVKKEDLRYYDVKSSAYKFENGTYKIFVGSSSRDIRLKTKIKVN